MRSRGGEARAAPVLFDLAFGRYPADIPLISERRFAAKLARTGVPMLAQRRLFLDVERSVTGRAWRDRLDERTAAGALSIVQRHGVPELLARIVAGRGIELENFEAFLDPTVKRLMPDPDALTDMAAASQRLADAVERGEQVAIFGDYDVDGATATAVLARFLRHGGLDPLIHIPDRIFEGYGPNLEASARFRSGARRC